MSDKKYHEAESLKEAMWKNFYREEDKWESTAEAEFLEAKGGQPRHWFQLGFSAGLDAVVKADPVPQEMSAREFVIAHHRMCQSGISCDECGITHDGEVPRSCAVLMGLNPDDTVAVVEKWAKEHPEERSEQ